MSSSRSPESTAAGTYDGQASRNRCDTAVSLQVKQLLCDGISANTKVQQPEAPVLFLPVVVFHHVSLSVL